MKVKMEEREYYTQLINSNQSAKHTDRQIDTPTDEHTHEHTDRQRDRQIHRHRHGQGDKP